MDSEISVCFRNLLVNGTSAESRAAVPQGETLISYYLVIFHPENTKVVLLQPCAAFFSLMHRQNIVMETYNV